MSLYKGHTEKTPATATHISLADAKTYLKVDYGADDTTITNIIKSAEEQVEGMTNRAVNEHDCTLYVTDTFTYEDTSNCDVSLMIGDVTDLVVYSVSKGVETELTLNSDYYRKGKNQVTLLNCADESQFRITYSVAAQNLPVGMDTAILKLVADYYENRSNDTIVPVMRVSEGTRRMIMQYADPLIFA